VGLNDGGLPDGGQLKNGLNGGAAAIRTAVSSLPAKAVAAPPRPKRRSGNAHLMTVP